jgi:hypothetical protein
MRLYSVAYRHHSHPFSIRRYHDQEAITRDTLFTRRVAAMYTSNRDSQLCEVSYLRLSAPCWDARLKFASPTFQFIIDDASRASQVSASWREHARPRRIGREYWRASPTRCCRLGMRLEWMFLIAMILKISRPPYHYKGNVIVI